MGVTALLIAAKYEEIYPPEMRDFLYITESAYTRTQILAEEYEMLRTLDFNVTVPSSFWFLERFIKLSESDDLVFNYSKYLIELTLLENKMFKWKQSLIASTAIYVTKKILKRN